MNAPERYNFLNHYQRDGMKPFKITLTYASGDPVDLTDAVVKLQMREPALDKVVYEFSSLGAGEKQITLPGDGVVQFPEIKTWILKPAVYNYDLQVTDATGFVITYLTGTWAIKKDVLK